MKTKIAAYLAVCITAALMEKAQAGRELKIFENMVWIPSGTFAMGSPDSESERRSDETQHKVTISRGFYISKFETTRREYFVVMDIPFYNTKDLERPIEGVVWSYALNYCARLTERDRKAGRLGKG